MDEGCYFQYEAPHKERIRFADVVHKLCVRRAEQMTDSEGIHFAVSRWSLRAEREEHRTRQKQLEVQGEQFNGIRKNEKRKASHEYTDR